MNRWLTGLALAATCAALGILMQQRRTERRRVLQRREWVDVRRWEDDGGPPAPSAA